MENRKSHSTTKLPERYTLERSINLQKDRKQAVIVNSLGLMIMAVMLLVGVVVSKGHMLVFPSILQTVVFAGGAVAYMCLHELTHAAVMKFFGAHSVRFGFTGMYAYAGSEEDYFDRYAYLRVALAPVIVWGIVFLVLCFLVPSDWFGVVYFLQIANVGGAAGDLYVSVLFSRIRRPV